MSKKQVKISVHKIRQQRSAHLHSPKLSATSQSYFSLPFASRSTAWHVWFPSRGILFFFEKSQCRSPLRLLKVHLRVSIRLRIGKRIKIRENCLKLCLVRMLVSNQPFVFSSFSVYFNVCLKTLSKIWIDVLQARFLYFELSKEASLVSNFI